MIEYWKGLFGLQLLVRGHGSAVMKGMIPGALAVCFYVGVVAYNDRQPEDFFTHPYAIGVYVGSIAFVIVFRLNNAYGRYWEACGSVFNMMSKFLDSTTHAGVYHLQQSHYEKYKPPSYYDHFELNFQGLTRDRERGMRVGLASVNMDPLAEHWEWDPNANLKNEGYNPKTRSINAVKGKGKFKESKVHKSQREAKEETPTSPGPSAGTASHLASPESNSMPTPSTPDNWGQYAERHINPTEVDTGKISRTASGHRFLAGSTRYDGNWSAMTKGRPAPPGGFTPPVYLQELCHLSSLLVAVAFSTLRNDIEGAEAPLDAYIPGQPWPEVDSDKMPTKVQHDFSPCFPFAKQARYLLGLDKTAKARTAYNAARPFLVLGGVSDGEIAMLQRARGAQAKTQLAWNWLSEFMIREHLAGSMGAVGPPIVSRCFQFLSDGMIPYHHARKIMLIPFPFVSAQLSVFFVSNLIWAIPLMLTQYVQHAWLGSVLSFFAVTCFAGMHEAARELENPFKNVPNEIPLCTLLAQYNESLLTMYYGYHPDHFWNADDFVPPKAATPSSKATAAPEPALKDMEKTISEQSREINELRNMIQAMQGSRSKKE